MGEGILAELEGIDLGDERLNKRSKKVLEALASTPQLSINASVEGWGDTLAAYRLFDNSQVTPELILAAHYEATKRRVGEQPVVLVVQDTTELDFSAHPPKDARCLNEPYRFGYYDHSHHALTPDKLHLGLLGSETYNRDAETLGTGRDRKSLPIEEKESLRWLTGYRLAADRAREFPGTRVISVADSEADIFDIFAEAQKEGSAADFVIRGKEDRCTPARQLEVGPAAYHKAWDEVAKSPLRMTRVIELPTTPKRAARKAHLEIRAIRLEVKRPHARPDLPNAQLHLVWVKEVKGPGDGTDIEWQLITTLPIESDADLLLVLDYYTARWPVEVYFRTLKTGYKVEDIQLERTHRVLNCLAFYKIIAWRIMYLTFMNRTCPDLPCDALFDESEWKSVWTVVQKEPLPSEPPKLSDFMKLVAYLGGYNNRPKEPPPGTECIWMGLRRMCDFTVAWQAFGPKH